MKIFVPLCVGLWLFGSFCYCNPAGYLRKKRSPAIYMLEVDEYENSTECELSISQKWSYDFHECFINRKYADGGKNLDMIIDRILEHSKDCVENSKKDCRPDMEGFLVILDKVIKQMKDYSDMYLQAIFSGREKIKDLDCVETTLSTDTYINCFRTVFDHGNSPEDEYKKYVEDGISCANKSNRKCSKAAKTSLNRIVRTILNVENPNEEDIEDDVRPSPTPPPPSPWYYFFVQPFISAWNAIRSFFGW